MQQVHIRYNKYTTYKVPQIHVIYNKKHKMTTIHARQIQLTKMHIKKTKKVLYIISNIFPPYCTHVFTSVLRFSPLYRPYISFPLHPAFTPSLCCTSLHFPSLHFTTLHFFYTFRWFSLHFISLHFSRIFRTLYFSLTHLNNRFPYPLSQGI